MNKLSASRLKSERLKKKKTQKDVADFLGMTKQAVQRYESGLSTPKLATWKKLANYFGVTESYLMGIDDYQSSLKEMVARMNEFNNSLLKDQLARIEQTELRPQEPLAIAHAIDLIMTTHDIYFERDDHDITIDLSVIITGLSRIVKNQSDEYEDTIERFTKLINLLKEQNKKATDND